MTIMNLAPLSAAVSQEVAAGRLGELVFARLTLVASSDHGHLLSLCEEAIGLVQELLQFPAEGVFARGSQESGNLSVQLDLEGGRSALASVAIRREEKPLLDLLLVGNHGTLHHRSDGEVLEDELALGLEDPGSQPDASAIHLRRALEESLRTGEPIEL